MQLDRYAKAGAMALALASLTMADGPKFTGYVTSTWNKDLNSPASGAYSNLPTTAGPINYYGGKEASFQMNAAHLNVTGGDAGTATYVIDLDAGTDAQHNVGVINTGSGYAIDLQQAYIAVPFGKTPVGLQAGKFYTSEGIEVLNSGLNPTITRGLLFGQSECVAHTGAILTFKANDQLNVAVGGVNGWDMWTTSKDDGIPMLYGKVGLAFGDPLAGTLSAYWGPYGVGRSKLTSVDFTGVTKVVKGLDLNFQANYLSKGQGYSITDIEPNPTNTGFDTVTMTTDLTNIGFGIQPLYHVSDAIQVGVRYEFLNSDPKDGKSTTVQTVALAPGYKLTPATLIRAEYRIDFASEKVFENDKGVYNKKVDQAITAELNYTF